MGYRVKGKKENASKGAGARFNDTTSGSLLLQNLTQLSFSLTLTTNTLAP